MKSNTSTNNYWIKSGLTWGALMFVIMEIVFPLINAEEIILSSLLVGVVLWTLGGLSFGFAMKVINRKPPTIE